MRGDFKILFDGPSVHQVMNHYVEKCVQEVDQLPEQEILSRTTDDIIQGFKDKYSVEVPELHEDQIYTDEHEVQHRWNDDDHERRFTRVQTAHHVTFHIPFTGDHSIFQISPSNRRLFGREITATDSEIIVSMPTSGTNAEGLKNSLQGTLGAVRQALETAKRDLSPFYQMIDHALRGRIDRRREASLKSKGLVASLGFPMKRRPDAPTTYRAPEVKRKIMPVRTGIATAFKPEPTLPEEEYFHILNVMDNMTKVIERSPHIFTKMGEEDIRQHFLVQLNGQYEGQATGETFNAAGKTDILIRSEGANIFIAECKFWHGEKGFLETVDQLLSYVTWRDTKTALVIFNRNKNLSGVIEAIKKAMPDYQHFKRGPKIEGETKLRYVLGQPNDPAREVIATVMVYDIPCSP